MTSFVVAFYEVDRHYGGPEEGGWWYDSGELLRTVRVFKSEDAAIAFCRRANNLLRLFINRHRRELSSVVGEPQVYAEVHDNIAPAFYPAQRPHYE